MRLVFRSTTRVRVVLLVIVLLALGGSAGASSAAAKPTRSHVTATFPRVVGPRGLIVVSGKARGHAPHARLRLERRVGGSWRAVSGRRRARTFSFHWRAPRHGHRLKLRVALTQGRRTLATSHSKTVSVRRGGPKVAGAGASATVIPPASVKAVPAAGSGGTVQLSGKWSPQVGSALAVNVGPNTPDGFLGKIVGVTHEGGGTLVQTVPTTLPDAIPDGSFSLDDATTVGVGKTLARRKPTESGRTPNRAMQKKASLNKDLGKAISCEGGGHFSVSGSVGLDATPDLKASWSLFHGVSASFTETVSASANLSAEAHVEGGCSFEKTGLFADPVPIGKYVAFVEGIPVVITLDGQVFLDGAVNASGDVSAGVGGNASASAGLSYSHGKFSAIGPTTNLTYGAHGPSVSAKADAGAHVTPELRILLYGAGGPVFDAMTGLDFHASTTENPWWTLTAPLQVTARLAVPSLDISSPSLNLYNHRYKIAQAGGGFGGGGGGTDGGGGGGGPVPAPSNSVLVFGTGDSGDSEPVDFAASTLTGLGYDVTETDTLPSDLSGFSEIYYISTDPLSDDDITALEAFVRSGRGLYLTGERPCCEDLNASDQQIVDDTLSINGEPGGGVEVGNQGDPFYDQGYVPINSSVIDGLATSPNSLSDWMVDAPGGMAGVAPANVFATSPDGTVPVAAAWDGSDVAGGGRLAIFMDINWLESYLDPDSASAILENTAQFLKG